MRHLVFDRRNRLTFLCGAAAAVGLFLPGCSTTDDGGAGADGVEDSGNLPDSSGEDTSADSVEDVGADVKVLDAIGDGWVPDVPEPDVDSDADGSDAGLDADLDAIADGEGGDADGGPPDAVVDGSDGANSTPDVDETGVPEPDVTADFTLCSEPGGDFNIYDIQNPDCPDHFSPEPQGPNGPQVELSGVVVTAVFGDTFFVQEIPGGPYSGLAVYAHGIPLQSLHPGDVIDVDGQYAEFYGLSQLWLGKWTFKKTVDPPAPYVAAHPAHLATGGALAEMFEGVLVQVVDVKTIHTKPDCPNDWGEFAVTGDLRIDDMAFKWTAHLGDHFESITGPLHFTFENFKIEPRGAEDVVVIGTGSQTALSKCIAETCEVPESELGTHQVVINEIMVDAFGNDTGKEWFELYNPTNQEIDLNGWEVRDCGSLKFKMQGSNLKIPAGGYFVVGTNYDPETNGGVDVDLAYGDAIYFPNTVGSLLLFNGSTAQAELIDHVRYTAFGPWKDVLIPSHSIERRKATGSGLDVNNWAPGSKVYGPSGLNHGTPGAANTAK